MGDKEENTSNELENRTYREIQHMAKSMGLPSNFKKIYLIELIYAKKHTTEENVQNIIQRVRQERSMMSKPRKSPSKSIKRQKKSYKKSHTVLSKNIYNSPPITLTPKRKDPIFVPCSLGHELLKYNPKRSILQTKEQNTVITPKINSDRVLRSFNVKTTNRPGYNIVSINANLNNVDKDQNSENRKTTTIKIITNGRSLSTFNITAKCVVRNNKPAILNSKPGIRNPFSITATTNVASSKRHRTLSGIFPLQPLEFQEQVKTKGFSLRRNDGSVRKINTLVQKRNGDIITISRNNSHSTEINVQDIINGITETNISNYSDTQNNNYQEMRFPTFLPLDNIPNQLSLNSPHVDGSNFKEQNGMENNFSDFYSEYYHKKIRAEQMKYQKLKEQEKGILPKINDVFTQFNNTHKDVTQPLYVQVNSDAESTQSYYCSNNNDNGIMLESIYNFKNHLLTNPPLLQIANTANTTCVYSAPTITTAMLHQPTSGTSDACNDTPFEPDNKFTNDTDTHLYDFMKFCEQKTLERNRDYSCSTCYSEPCHELESDVTIPEMVEDALEIISQDGDYMERIEMDVRVQCVICSWAGPKIILEYHIRKEHAEEIYLTNSNESNISFSLGSLMRHRLWISRVLRHGTGLYAISGKYHEPDSFTATLTSLSTEDTNKIGSLTVYNKLSSEPFTWNHYIQQIPTDLPYANPVQGLKINISDLDLLPNSSNSKLLNTELSVLDEINVTLFVKIFN